MNDPRDDDPEGAGGSYDPSEEGPEAKLHRAEDEEQLRKDREIDRLLSSLVSLDAHRHLFTWTEMVQWNLKHKRIPRRGR